MPFFPFSIAASINMSPRTDDKGGGHVISKRSLSIVASLLKGDGEYFEDMAPMEARARLPMRFGLVEINFKVLGLCCGFIRILIGE